MKTKMLIALFCVVVLASVAYISYSAGQAQERIKWLWVPKEHDLLRGSVDRIEILLSHGDTGAVIRAVGAYNAAVQAATNDVDFCRAAGVLWEHTQKKP